MPAAAPRNMRREHRSAPERPERDRVRDPLEGDHGDERADRPSTRVGDEAGKAFLTREEHLVDAPVGASPRRRSRARRPPARPPRSGRRGRAATIGWSRRATAKIATAPSAIAAASGMRPQEVADARAREVGQLQRVDRVGARAEAGPGSEPDVDERADPRRQQPRQEGSAARARPRPAISRISTAAITGEPKMSEIAAKPPAAPTIVIASGGRSRRQQRHEPDGVGRRRSRRGAPPARAPPRGRAPPDRPG